MRGHSVSAAVSLAGRSQIDLRRGSQRAVSFVPRGPGPRPGTGAVRFADRSICRPEGCTYACANRHPARLRPAALAAVARQIAADLDQWRHLLQPGPQQGCGHRLVVARDHEVWLRCWLPGQWTGLHDHGGSVGAFAIARGEVREPPSNRPAVTPSWVC